MLRIFNGILVVAVITSAFVLYSLEHASRQNERQIAALKKQIGGERENIKLLKAEWSNLTRPERLERLAREHLNMRPVAPEQLVKQADLAGLLPARATPFAPQEDKDLIGNMLKGLE